MFSFSNRASRLIPSRLVPQTCTVFLSAALFASAGLSSLAQSGSQPQSSSSSSSQPSEETTERPKIAPRIAQPEAGGSAVTLETNEPLFDLAVALNACGYDADLEHSIPVRLEIREEVNTALTASADARDHRDALCNYIRLHNMTDSGLNLGQYISLALYLNPPPQLTPTVEETELPPDSTQVVNILPLLRTFGEDVHLHALWVEHRPEYEAAVGKVHDSLTKMILATNVYLRLPVSSYDGRRFLVLMEPMLAPSATNARIYGNDYIVVGSPAAVPEDANPATAVHMDDIRHTYLHYEVEPLIYARASAMDRLLPLLKAVQDAPLDFTYKSDIAAFLTECLIKAVEAQTMDVGIARPKRPTQVKQRADLERYDAEMTEYNRQAEAVRRKSVDLSKRQGWVLVDYFYAKLGQMERDGVSLKDDIGEMVYGMDVDRQRHDAEQVAFLPQGTHDLVRRGPRQLSGLDLAEMKLMKGDLDGATSLARTALSDPAADHAEAHYVIARANLMQRQPEEAQVNFEATLKLSKDPRTLAWSHIYLGRLYDVQSEREKAVEEYRAALTVRDSRPDTKAAAEQGLKQPFAAPNVQHQEQDDNAPLDPSGKAEKDAYRPPSQH
ncbi:hypothetical protein [Edaphobacter bradus]|uniref:hypothetical protein n=1 Tax=Edaphobacter bradus TaxID=2259016 RepID=UPI0021DF60F9|nr:hypothetical protein [Edaphobacter bradus]